MNINYFLGYQISVVYVTSHSTSFLDRVCYFISFVERLWDGIENFRHFSKFSNGMLYIFKIIQRDRGIV